MAKQTPNSEILAASKRSEDGRTPKSAWLVSALLRWFARYARDLPWRRTRDPYAIWVSEIMLQQTQVKTVLPYWKRWMRELPTVEAAAHASSAKIHKLWEGLGYYTRARNLQKAAREIVEKHGGKFPQHFNDVLALPGIGRYTAGAICSIAFNQPMPILDGNVIRVLTRIFGIGKNPLEKRTNEQLWKLAEELVGRAVPSPPRRGADTAPYHSFLNQSLMELGALVCLPRNPLCPVCPVKKFCVAFRENRVEELPNLGHRATTTARHFIAFIVEQTGRFLVRQRPAGVVNAHLWEFPNVEIGARLTEPQHADSKVNPLRVTDPRSGAVAETAVQILGIKPKEISPLCTVKHSITRYRITLEAFYVRFGGASSASPKNFKIGRRGTPPSGTAGVWRTPAQMCQLAFTAAHRKILHVLAATGRPHCAVRSSAFRRPA
jgi:A/G-specific adenine glycosylase